MEKNTKTILKTFLITILIVYISPYLFAGLNLIFHYSIEQSMLTDPLLIILIFINIYQMISKNVKGK